MIFYFSGTGNTKHVAQQLAAKLNDHTTEVAEALAHGNTAYTLAPGESIGFAFPTYAWGLPPVALLTAIMVASATLLTSPFCTLYTPASSWFQLASY